MKIGGKKGGKAEPESEQHFPDNASIRYDHIQPRSL